jgi:hypothetical protein
MSIPTPIPADAWRKKARHSEPRAWPVFLRVLSKEKKQFNHYDSEANVQRLWAIFLEGWKRRARCYPFNTIGGLYRDSVHNY